MDLLLGIDIGSTSIKTNFYDIKGQLVSGGRETTKLSFPYKEHPTWSVWEPDTIWKAVKSSISKAVKKLDSKNEIRAVAVTGFGMDGVPIDINGNWLYPFISWHCPRTEKQYLQWSNEVGAEVIFSKSGKQAMHIDTVYRILWMKENYPEILDKTFKWLLIEDYINFLLCGEIATDYSMASSTSLFDQTKRVWSSELIKKADFDPDILPEALPSGTVLGNVTSEASRQTGLTETTKVVLGGHDYHCAALALGAIKPELVMDIIGTWEMIFQTSNKPKLEKEIFRKGINAESHVVKDKYNIITFAVSGMVYECLIKTLYTKEQMEAGNDDISLWEIIEKKAVSAPVGSNGVFFAPYIMGAGSPHIDNKASGAFIGLTNKSDKSSLIRSVVEALNYQFREMLDAFEDATKSSTEKIIATGGATKNRFWMQNKADITGKSIEVPSVEEATPLGAALISGIGIGIYRNEAEAYEQTYRSGITYEPDPRNGDLYNEYYNIYKKIYFDLKGLNSDIHNKFRK
jgi:xylulokinase